MDRLELEDLLAKTDLKDLKGKKVLKDQLDYLVVL